MSDYRKVETLSHTCQKILPLVYDESLSYYEILCKVVRCINDLIANGKVASDELEDVKHDVAVIQKYIDNFDENIVKDAVEKWVATMIFVEITDSGYIVYHIPEAWDNITFNTTGLDISLSEQPNYGHLVLSY